MKQQSRSPNILIIDDEASICESLSGVLEDEGYSVNTAPSGEEGIRVMASEPIDLVFLDILMPGGMDGIETLKRIKHHTPDVEVVMVSGHGTFDLALEAGQLGARDFLGKPLSLDTVLATVERLTQRSKSDAEFERPIIGRESADTGDFDENPADCTDKWADTHYWGKRYGERTDCECHSRM